MRKRKKKIIFIYGKYFAVSPIRLRLDSLYVHLFVRFKCLFEVDDDDDDLSQPVYVCKMK